MLINRFMLNLRQLGESETSSTEPFQTFSTPIVRISADVVGNMGESLDFGGQNGADDYADGEWGKDEDGPDRERPEGVTLVMGSDAGPSTSVQCAHAIAIIEVVARTVTKGAM